MKSGLVLNGIARGEYRECSSEIMEVDECSYKDLEYHWNNRHRYMEPVKYILYKKIWDLSGERKVYFWELA